MSRPRHRCERCARSVVAVRPPLASRVLAVAMFAFFIPLTFAIGASGLLLLGGGIVLLAMGALVLGPLIRDSFEPPKCPDCGCVVSKLGD